MTDARYTFVTKYGKRMVEIKPNEVVVPGEHYDELAETLKHFAKHANLTVDDQEKAKVVMIKFGIEF